MSRWGAQLRQRRPRIDEEELWRAGLAGAASCFLLILTIAALLPSRGTLDTGTVALLMLLPPLVATYAGRTLSLALAFLSALCFNFFFTHPYDSLRIESSASIAAFVIYIFISVVMAAIVGRFRSASRIAEQRTRDTELLQELAVELMRNDQLAPTLRSTLNDLVKRMDLRGAALQVGLGESDALAEAGDSERAAAALRQLQEPSSPAIGRLNDEGGVVSVPIATSDAVFGFLVVDAGRSGVDAETRRVLESYAGVIGLAAGRAQLQQDGIRRRALEESDRLRAALLQSVSHDLRTPLTAIRTLAAGLVRFVPAGEPESLLMDIEGQTARMQRLVDNMLDLSRIEAGALRPRTSSMPVGELLDAVAADVSTTYPAAELDVEVPHDIPPIRVDKVMLRHVLTHLVENALQAQNGDAGQIELRAGETDHGVVVAVIDHGPGIPIAERRRVFEPYYRLRPGQRRQGTGLGLAISRGFIEAHGGTIRIETTPGGGATFIVELPADPVA